MHARSIDRRKANRSALFQTRRRYPRLGVRCDVFYDSDVRSVLVRGADVSLRGMFLRCPFPDAAGTRAVVRIDTGDGPLLKLAVEVLRVTTEGRRGMALRLLEVDEATRLRLGAFLLRQGGLGAFPQLDRKFSTLARAPRDLHPL